MITHTSLCNPLMINKILDAVVDSQAMADKQGGHGKSYITDENGDNIMRLDVFNPGVLNHFPNGGVIVYGEESKNITSTVEKALECYFASFFS